MSGVETAGAVPLGEALRWGAKALDEAGAAHGQDAARQAAILLACSLRTSIGEMYTSVSVVDPGSMDLYRGAIERRRAREPLQYIAGEQEFMSLGFFVDRRVLIPRPETELLAEAAIGHLGGQRDRLFADVGTGSGALAVSIAWFTGCRGYGLDVSADAIEVARLNARRHSLDGRIEFFRGDLLQPLTGRGLERRLDCVVSNPPYVTEDEYEYLQPEVRDYEPRSAILCTDLPSLYRRLASEAAGFLKAGGLFAVEIGYGQAGYISGAIREIGFYEGIELLKDLAGIERVIRCLRVE